AGGDDDAAETPSVLPRAVMTIACFYSNMEIAGARGRSRRVFRGPPPTRAHHIGTAGRAGVPRREIDRGFAAASPVRPRNVLRIASAPCVSRKVGTVWVD